MNAVLGFAQLLSYQDGAQGDASAARRRTMTHITDAGQHLMALIDDVLELSRLEGGELPLKVQPVLLATAVEGALGMLDLALRERAIAVQLGALDCSVLGDATRLPPGAAESGRQRHQVRPRGWLHPHRRHRNGGVGLAARGR